MNEVFKFTFSVVIVFFSIIAHECAHGWMAFRRGDPTAKLAGRLTVNPLRHIDPVGTLLIPGVLLYMLSIGYPVIVVGWAKPVPVNFARLKNPKQDMIWVGLAGPLTNILIALIFRLMLMMPMKSAYVELWLFGMFVNLLLAVFNLIPIPPLDGSRLIMGLLPFRIAKAYSYLEPFGILIVIFLLYFGLLQRIILPIIELLGNLMGVQFR